MSNNNNTIDNSNDASLFTANSLSQANSYLLESRMQYLWSISHNLLKSNNYLLSSMLLHQFNSILQEKKYTLEESSTNGTFCTQCCVPLVPILTSNISFQPNRDNKNKTKKLILFN